MELPLVHVIAMTLLTVNLKLPSFAKKIYKEHKQFVQMWRKRKRMVGEFFSQKKIQFSPSQGINFNG